MAALERGYLASENQMLKALSTLHPWFGLAPNLLDNDIRPHQIRAGVPHGTYFGQCWSWWQTRESNSVLLGYEPSDLAICPVCYAYNIRITVLFQPLTS